MDLLEKNEMNHELIGALILVFIFITAFFSTIAIGYVVDFIIGRELGDSDPCQTTKF